MNKPNAPTSAVREIVQTFRGIHETGAPDGWRVSFDNRADEQNATLLISMLQGWRAEPEGNIKNMICILPE